MDCSLEDVQVYDGQDVALFDKKVRCCWLLALEILPPLSTSV